MTPADGIVKRENIKYEAIYARQSVNRIDSISIENQIETCKKELTSGEYRVYIDRGFSGKNTDRPDFQRMMRDVAEGAISRVIVYKLDRISRSVLDFAGMIETFRRYRVDFVSSNEKFDTATPVGNAMLMLVMVFAQLERETIRQRVTDSYAARCRRGFFMGGVTPFGYKARGAVIDGINTKMFVPDENESRIVKTVFALYADPANSLGDVVRYLEENRLFNRNGGLFAANRLRGMIVNPVYVRADGRVYDFFKSNGTNIASARKDFDSVRGAYLYSGESESSKRSDLRGSTLVIAPHEGLIDAETWLKCRQKCMGGSSAARSGKAKATWLAGKIKCARCGYALAAKTAYRKTVPNKRYFICTGFSQALNCGVGALDADAVEAAVFGEICRKLAPFRVLTHIENAPEDPKLETLRAQIARAEAEIAAYLEKIPSANAAAMRYINEKIGSLDREKKKLCRRIDELSAKPWHEKADSISGYMERWNELTVSDKAAVAGVLIESVRASKTEIEIRWKI